MVLWYHILVPKGIVPMIRKEVTMKKNGKMQLLLETRTVYGSNLCDGFESVEEGITADICC